MAFTEQDTERETIAQFIHHLRETVSVNRIAVYLVPFNPSQSPYHSQGYECAYAIGISPEARRRVQISESKGIGRWIRQHGKILRREDTSNVFNANENLETQREFDTLNCQIAVPITDRETLVGLALLGDPVVSHSFSTDDLWKVFRLMEEFGVQFQNHRRQNQYASENHLLNRILSGIDFGVLVVDSEMAVLKSNPTMNEFLGFARDTQPAFEDIPETLASQICGALEQQQIPPPFFLSVPSDPDKRVFQATLTSLGSAPGDKAQLIMVVMEDYSEIEAAKQSAIESTTSRLQSQLQLLGTRSGLDN